MDIQYFHKDIFNDCNDYIDQAVIDDIWYEVDDTTNEAVWEAGLGNIFACIQDQIEDEIYKLSR